MRHVVIVSFALIASSCLDEGFGRSEGENDPVGLQRRAIQRIDDFTDTFRKSGVIAPKLPELQRAFDELEVSKDAFVRNGDRAATALCLIKEGDVVRMVSDLRGDQAGRIQALELYRQGEVIAREAWHRTYQARALIGQVRVESSRMGATNLGAAVSHIEQAVGLGEASGDDTLQFETLEYSAFVQMRRNNLRGALTTFDRALSLLPKIADPFLAYFLYLDRADVYEKRVTLAGFEREFDACFEAIKRAHADYVSARALAQARGYRHLAMEVDKFLGRLEVTRNSLEIEDRFQKGEWAKIFDDRDRGIRPLVNEEFVPPPAGGPVALPMLLQEVLKETFTGDAQSYRLLGLANEISGKDDEALQAYLQGVRLLENDRGRVEDEQGRMSFFEDKVGCYHASIRHFLKRKQFAEAFELMEKSRARVLTDLLASRTPNFTDPKERDLDSQCRKLEAQIGVQQGKMLNYSDDDAERGRFEKRIARLEENRRGVLEQMSRESPRLHGLHVSTPKSLREVQAFARRRGAAILDYLVLRDSVIVWLIDENDVRVRSVFLPRVVLASKVEKLLNDLKVRPAAPNVAFEEKTARELFGFLVEPILPWLKTEHLIILPHGALNEIPFEVLLDATDRRFLGDRFRITYAPSATILLGLKDPKPLSAGKMLVVAARSIDLGESGSIARLFPDRCQVETNLGVAELKELVPRYDFLHISAHGAFDLAEPMLSHLALREIGQAGGKLTAAEIYGLPLRESSMVVLSACEIGRSKDTHGNELLGILRPLIYAGAGTLVLTRWEVDAAATRLWMECFYREGRSQEPGTAARLASATIRENKAYQHPFYWSPFLVVGR